MKRTAVVLVLCGCSIVESADDIVVGGGGVSTDAGDAGAAFDAQADAGASGGDPRWAGWRMPSITPTDYADGGAPGIVVDHVTGLEWQRDVGAASAFDAASAGCASLDLAGKGWRLPTRIELVSLLTFGRGVVPAINQSAFPGTPVGKYWTQSTLGSGGRYVVDFGTGAVGTAVGSEADYHRCVRSP